MKTTIALIIMWLATAYSYRCGDISTSGLYIITCILIVALQIERVIDTIKNKKSHETTD